MNWGPTIDWSTPTGGSIQPALTATWLAQWDTTLAFLMTQEFEYDLGTPTMTPFITNTPIATNTHTITPTKTNTITSTSTVANNDDVYINLNNNDDAQTTNVQGSMVCINELNQTITLGTADGGTSNLSFNSVAALEVIHLLVRVEIVFIRRQ